MNYNKLSPTPVDEVKFIKSFAPNVPEKSGCYVLTDSKGIILYIGKSNDLRERFLAHLGTKRAVAFYFIWVLYDKSKIKALEIQWFRTYKRNNAGQIPKMNIQDPSN